MADQLNAIKRRHKSLTQRQGTDLCRDFEWLIAEVERLRQERTDVIEELSRRYGNMFASPTSEPVTTEVFREAQQLAARRLRRLRNDV